jgi:hypothetical protein
MILRQSFCHFSRGNGCAIGSRDPKKAAISQQKPGKVIFHRRAPGPPRARGQDGTDVTNKEKWQRRRAPGLAPGSLMGTADGEDDADLLQMPTKSCLLAAFRLTHFTQEK